LEVLLKSIEGIRQRCRDWNDLQFYNRLYVLQVSTAGFLEWIDTGVGALCQNWSERQGMGKADIPDYPLIDPGEQLRGVTNHMLINDRIAVASVVLTLPEIHLKIDDMTEREIGEKVFEDLWINGDWSEEVKMSGMDVRSNAIGWLVCGPNDAPMGEQVPMWVHVDSLDMLFDRGYKSPGRWRGFCYRERVPLDDAVERFGHIFNQDFASGGWKERQRLQEDYNIVDTLSANLTDYELDDVEIFQKIKDLCVRRVDPLNRSWMDSATLGGMAGQTNVNDFVLHVWHYWDRDNHIMFLSSIDGNKSIPVTYRQMAGVDSGWNYQVATEAGPNPYGILPGAWWLGNWSSGMLRPTPTSETVKPLSDMLRYIEALMVKTIKQSLPMIVVNSGGMGTQEVEFRAQWDEAVKTDRPMAYLEMTYGVDMKEVVQRLDVGGFKPEWIELRNILKQELDAATGVTGPYRGQGLSGGEKTRKEATSLLHAADTQQRDMRNQYAKLLEMMVRVTRIVGAIVDTKPRLLMLDDGPVQINGQGFPVAQFVSKPCHVFIDPNDTIWIPKEERQAAALAEWKEAQVMVQQGIMSPMRAAQNFLEKFSGRKALKMLFTPEELKQNQDAKSQAAQAQQAQELVQAIKAALNDLPDELKQRWAEKIGLCQPGQKLNWGPDTKDIFEAQVELGKHASALEHEQRLASLDRVKEATEMGREHAHERRMQREKPKPVASSNGKSKSKARK